MEKILLLEHLSTIFQKVKDYVASVMPGVATSAKAGLVKIGANISVAEDGTISVAAPKTKVSELENDSKFQTESQVSTAISTAVSDLIGGAPETYDTLKEISDYIEEHEDVVTSLNAAIGNKADKTSVYTKDETDSTFLKSADVTVATVAEITAVAASVFEA